MATTTGRLAVCASAEKLIAVNAADRSQKEKPRSPASHSTKAIHEQEVERGPLILLPECEVLQREDEEGVVVEGLVRRTLTESRKLWRVADPSIFCRLAMFSLTVISPVFVSHLGSLDLAVLSIATTVNISFSFGSMTWTGFSSRALDDILLFFRLSIASRVILLLENVYYRSVIILSGHLHISEISLDSPSIWVRVANELGAGKANSARFAMSVSLFNAVIVGMIFWPFVIAFPDQLAIIFTPSDSIVRAVTQLCTLLAFAFLINCVQPVFSGVAVGCGWQELVTIVNLRSYYVVGLPLGMVLGWLLPFSIKGIWSGLICGTMVRTLFLGLIAVKCDWEEEVRNLAMEAHGSAEGMAG